MYSAIQITERHKSSSSVDEGYVLTGSPLYRELGVGVSSSEECIVCYNIATHKYGDEDGVYTASEVYS